ncbi:nucleoside diphosphate kinase regulator [Devosia epidermidihirudinis]|uniref:Nucleoside diphosphate kinase regulator n=1 Tax=Devosia epidermidihirudinis TaxID=1293439 RepID=A0A0F5QMQ9_9HYPH|nr:nucleoside diphosphate kinase regulator [Devosia epidermidihirudinis]KKC41309.1 nucleoside diphosphate kinase regulator [Devosia epidermidihirudinis]KKC41329.1 nucleoside diphosphate kinase regulator [Devosia epidermidihirudinis]
MTETIHNDLNPEIILGHADHRQLNILAMAGLDHTPEQSDNLLYELERARVLEDTDVPTDIVRMGSSVRYRTDTGQETDVVLVYPADADIAEGRISVMTPVGTALIGLRAGQSITWRGRNNKRHMLTVLSVLPAKPAAE